MHLACPWRAPSMLLVCFMRAPGVLLACIWHATRVLLGCFWLAASELLACCWLLECSWHASGTLLMCFWRADCSFLACFLCSLCKLLACSLHASGVLLCSVPHETATEVWIRSGSGLDRKVILAGAIYKTPLLGTKNKEWLQAFFPSLRAARSQKRDYNRACAVLLCCIWRSPAPSSAGPVGTSFTRLSDDASVSAWDLYTWSCNASRPAATRWLQLRLTRGTRSCMDLLSSNCFCWAGNGFCCMPSLQNVHH